MEFVATLILLLILVLLIASPLMAFTALRRTGLLERRLADLETRKAGPEPSPSSKTETEPTSAATPAPLEGRPTPPPAPPEPEAPASAEPPPPIGPPASTERPALTGPPSSETQIELLIGTRWLNIAGIITLLFAAAFFLKYAYENAWIGPRGRVAIGILSGLGGIFLGELTRRRRHAVFAQGVTAGGIACLYLSFFFSFRLYRLIEIAPAFALMALAIAAGVALALLQDSLAVGLLSFFGAYLTPFLLSTGQDAAGFLFTYLTMLAVAVLAVTRFRKWRSLEILAFVGTFVTFGAWYGRHYAPDRLPVALAGLSTFFVLFILVPYGHSLARRAMTGPKEHVMALADAAMTFGFLYRMIYPMSPRALGFIALGLSAVFLALGALARKRVPSDRPMAISILGMSVAFLAIAVPLQLGLHGITIAWAAQGLVIIHLGRRYRSALTRLGGLAVLSLAVFRLLVRHVPLHDRPFLLFWNASFGTWFLVVCAVLGASWIYGRSRDSLHDEEESLPSGLTCAGALLLLGALHMETDLFFRLRDLSPDHRAGWVLFVWVVLPQVLLWHGRHRRDSRITMAGIVLVFLSALPLLALVGRVLSAPDPLFASLVFWMGVMGVGSFMLASALLLRGESPVPGIDRILKAAGAFLLLVLLTAEVHSHFVLAEGTQEETANNSLRASLAVSVLWAVFASALMTIGFRAKDRAFRYAATGLFGITLLKAFVYDVLELRAVYRIISFLVLGLLLVAASFLYSRYRGRIAGSLLVAILMLGSTGRATAAFDPSRWQYVAPVETAGLEGPYGWLTLGPDVLSRSRPDMADLRIVGRDGREVPSLVTMRESGSTMKSLQPRILNRTFPDGGGTSLELDFEGRFPKNLLEVRTSGESFRRRVKVEGRDEGEGEQSWKTLGDDYWIHRLERLGDMEPVERDEVMIPENDFQRLRVTIYPMPGESEAPHVLEVRAYLRTVVEAEVEELPGATWASRHDAESRTTVIDLDLGYRNALAREVTFDFSEEAFRRHYRILGRNEKTERLERATETGGVIEERREAPWAPLGSGAFYRLPAGRRGEAPVDETRILLARPVPARYLRVEISDRDNPPLDPIDVEVLVQVRRVVFPLRRGTLYRFFTGNPEAVRPVYDLADVLPDLRAQVPAPARLGPLEENPRYRSGPAPPFTERHPWLLWVVLLAAAAGLALLILRNMRSI